MRKTIVSLVALLGLSAATYGQSILINNTANSGAIGALSGGLVYTNNLGHIGLFNGNLFNVGMSVSAGPVGGSLTPVMTMMGNVAPAGTGFDYGKFSASPNNPYNLTANGIAAGGTAQIQLQLWLDTAGQYATYGQAVAAGDLVAQATFTNPTGNPGATPPVPNQSLSGMPSMTLIGVPEPSTIALAGLGAVAFLVSRRRKQS